MKNYELILILSPNLREEETNDVVGSFVSFIQEQGGLLSNQSQGKKTPLPDSMQKHEEGILTTITFSVNPDKIKEIETRLKETPSVLRHMLVHRLMKTAVPKTTISPPPQEAKVERVKADAKEIDEKLKEIFKEATQL